MRALHAHPRQRQRGAAALLIVMMLFFIMSLVAAYASRNLIFEQRTSANNYRSTQAFDAAEAGLEWAVAMLNGGRIDAACAGSADPARNSFRERYLSMEADGQITVRQWVDAGEETPLLPSCVGGASGWSCSCPDAANPSLAAPTGSGAAPTFSVRFEVTTGQPSLVRVFSKGCSSFGTQCFADAGSAADAEAEVIAVLGLAPALTQTPVAAITVRGALEAPDAQFVNPDTTGIAVNVGGTANAPRVTGPAGMSATSAQGRLVVDHDSSLSGVTPAGSLSLGEMMFLATFGMPPAAFRVQPAVVRLSCGDDCAAALLDAAARFPARTIWIDGDLNLAGDTVLELGSAASPALVVVNGNVNWAAGSNVLIHGLVYARGGTWSSAGATATVVGALLAEGEAGTPDEGKFSIVGEPRFVFDAAIVDHLKKVQARRVFDFGSFARVPGSWRDFR
jgi:Tfp pilus assembly protein PilX